jgi:hypothetical protein
MKRKKGKYIVQITPLERGGEDREVAVLEAPKV